MIKSTKKDKQQLDAFTKKIGQVEARTRLDEGKKRSDIRFSSGWGLGVRLATELLGGVVVGAGIGLLLDSWLGLAPLFLVVFIVLGSAAGFLNVYRVAQDSIRQEEQIKQKEDLKKEE